MIVEREVSCSVPLPVQENKISWRRICMNILLRKFPGLGKNRQAKSVLADEGFTFVFSRLISL